MNQKLIICDEICGFEFDWYAVDLSGQYALFSTAGSGIIPECIKPYIEEYSNVSVPDASRGDNPWGPLSKAGLFVFDMFSSDDYIKNINAECRPKTHLLKELEGLPSLLQFNGYFEHTPQVINLLDFSLKNGGVKNTTSRKPK